MNLWHWSEYHVAWLRAIVPELGDDPVYIRHTDELPEWMRESSVIAWTESAGDLKLKDRLTELGEWQGRGHFIAINSTWNSLTLEKQNAILLHETAHALGGFDSLLRKPEEGFSDIERTLLSPGGRETLMLQFGLKPLDDLTESRGSHDLRFVRCCLHLWARCWDTILLDDMCVFHPTYSLDWDQSRPAIQTLRSEIRKGGHIVDILKSDPPPEFAALFTDKQANSQ